MTPTKVMESCKSSTLVQFCWSICSVGKFATISDLKAVSNISGRIQLLDSLHSGTQGNLLKVNILAKGDLMNNLYQTF
jgi:hypothetical protein